MPDVELGPADKLGGAPEDGGADQDNPSQQLEICGGVVNSTEPGTGSVEKEHNREGLDERSMVRPALDRTNTPEGTEENVGAVSMGLHKPGGRNWKILHGRPSALTRATRCPALSICGWV